ncbi:type IV secretory system conjugative DNA transfer family protein [Pseudovibrio ascidiaceicola]|uniref:type IV secretory system conjugative DNA transfer family protein n=1 Tax=Pseudovibrio ascidiaceicola TaxID=285279 RepID=UPI003D36906E
MPFKIAMQEDVLDAKELGPDKKKPHIKVPQKSEGIFYLGNELVTGKEVWLNNSDCRQHFLLLGTTGAGKTEALLGLAANAMTWGSGFIFIDGKGDIATWGKVYALCRHFGREDDLLVLDYMTGNADVSRGAKIFRSNTLNPFAFGASDNMASLVISLMPEQKGDDMWKGRAIKLLKTVISVLAWMRDEKHVEIDIQAIRDNLGLREAIDFSDPDQYPDMPENLRYEFGNYLKSVPGYLHSRGYDQSDKTREQHSYLEMQFTELMSNLGDVYGHIFRTPLGDVDMFDVVLNRRILLVMLPALEKSPDEVAGLGKLIIANLRSVMAGTLGYELEGTFKNIIETRLTASASPYMAIMDEVAQFIGPSLDTILSQSRSLGFSDVLSGQDLAALEKSNPAIAKTIYANTNTSILGRSEDKDAIDMFTHMAGKAHRAEVNKMHNNVSTFSSSGWNDQGDTAIHQVDRVSPRDIVAQGPGEFHVRHMDYLLRITTFFANPDGLFNKDILYLRANHFLRVRSPSMEEIERHKRIPKLALTLTDPKKMAQRAKMCIAIQQDLSKSGSIGRVAVALYNAGTNPIYDDQPVQASCAALADLMKANREKNMVARKQLNSQMKGSNVGSLRPSKSAQTGQSTGGATLPAPGLPPVPPVLPDTSVQAQPTSPLLPSAGQAGHPIPVPALAPAPEGQTGQQPSSGTEQNAAIFDTAQSHQAAPQAQRQQPQPVGDPHRGAASTPHGATFDGQTIDHAKVMAASGAATKAIAVLNFDPDTVDSESVREYLKFAMAPKAPIGHATPSMMDAADLSALDAQLSSVLPTGNGSNDPEPQVSQYVSDLLSDDESASDAL